MSARIVCDASALVALLLDSGPAGQWVTKAIAGSDLAAPSLVEFESANIIRRHELAGIVSADQAAQAHADLLDLAIEPWPYELMATRAWELRHNLSSYDASYVALAELIDAPLVTLDVRISGAPGLRCTVATPPAVAARVEMAQSAPYQVPTFHGAAPVPGVDLNSNAALADILDHTG